MRRWQIAGLAAVALIAAAALVRGTLGPAVAADRYSVVEGDTLEWIPGHCWLSPFGVGCPAQRLRLFGVDAFESRQTCRDGEGQTWPCGAVATERLKELARHPDFACHADPEFVDRHAREFSVCSTGGRDVGAVLVEEGLAFSYGRGVQYLPLEAKAREEHRGAWAGYFVRPQYFREGAIE